MGLQVPPLKLQPVFFMKMQLVPGLIVTQSIACTDPFSRCRHTQPAPGNTTVPCARLCSHNPQLSNRYRGELPSNWQDLGETLSRNQCGG
jgi:hypothetical protein